jgi:CAAX prenyl protease-like protein
MSEPSSPKDLDRTALPYIIPMAGFLVLTQAESYLPAPGVGSGPHWYPIAYAAKVAIVAALAWACRSSWRDLRPWPGPAGLALSAALGLAIAALWVGLDGHYPTFRFLGTRTGYDPNVLPPAAKWAFVAVRLLGLAVLVPLIEELFWRSFLIRWIVDPDFARVPIGRVTPLSATITSICFALEHPEWLPGLITGFAWAWLLARTRSVSACVVSHMAANLGLGLYVLATGDWKFW